MDVRGREGRVRLGSGGRPRHKDRTRAVTPAAILFAGLGFTGLKNKGIKHKELEQFLCPQGLKSRHTVNSEHSAQVAKKTQTRMSVCFVFTSMILFPSTDLKGHAD